jgi:peroxiredoxin family protein
MGWGEGNDDLLFSFVQGDFSGLSQINKRQGANMGKMLDSFVSKSTTRNTRKIEKKSMLKRNGVKSIDIYIQDQQMRGVKVGCEQKAHQWE